MAMIVHNVPIDAVINSQLQSYECTMTNVRTRKRFNEGLRALLVREWTSLRYDVDCYAKLWDVQFPPNTSSNNTINGTAYLWSPS